MTFAHWILFGRYESSTTHGDRARTDGSSLTFDRNGRIISVRYPDGKTLELKYDNIGAIKWFQDSTGEYVRGNVIFATDPTPMYSWIQPGRQPWRGSIDIDHDNGTVSLIDFDSLTRTDTRSSLWRTEVGNVGVNDAYFIESDFHQRPVRIICGTVAHELRWRRATLASVIRSVDGVIEQSFSVDSNGLWKSERDNVAYRAIEVLSDRSIQYTCANGDKTVYRIDGQIIHAELALVETFVDLLFQELGKAYINDQTIIDIVAAQNPVSRRMLEESFESDSRSRGVSLRATLRKRMWENGWRTALNLLDRRFTDSAWTTARNLKQLFKRYVLTKDEFDTIEEKLVHVFSSMDLAQRQAVSDLYESPFGLERNLFDDLFGEDSPLRDNLSRLLLQSLWYGNNHLHRDGLLKIVDQAIEHGASKSLIAVFQVLDPFDRVQYIENLDRKGQTGDQRIEAAFGGDLSTIVKSRVGLPLSTNILADLALLPTGFGANDFVAATDRSRNIWIKSMRHGNDTRSGIDTSPETESMPVSPTILKNLRLLQSGAWTPCPQ